MRVATTTPVDEQDHHSKKARQPGTAAAVEGNPFPSRPGSRASTHRQAEAMERPRPGTCHSTRDEEDIKRTASAIPRKIKARPSLLQPPRPRLHGGIRRHDAVAVSKGAKVFTHAGEGSGAWCLDGALKKGTTPAAPPPSWSRPMTKGFPQHPTPPPPTCHRSSTGETAELRIWQEDEQIRGKAHLRIWSKGPRTAPAPRPPATDSPPPARPGNQAARTTDATCHQIDAVHPDAP